MSETQGGDIVDPSQCDFRLSSESLWRNYYRMIFILGPMAEFVVKEAAFPFNPKGFLFRFDFSDHHSTGILVAITQVLWKPRGLLVDQFDSKSDLINAVHTSSFIPG